MPSSVLMPPKAKAAKPDKAKQAAKAKTVEDKTFGLKNKNKSKNVQNYVAQVQKTATANDRKPNEDKKEKKKREEEAQKELNALFAQAIKQPKVPVGVDPKSLLCEYHKAGQCTKGFKCKFSHDLNIGRKTQKIDLFSDKREGEEDEEGMQDWDQEQLEKVVNQKHGAEKQPNRTEIICKFFLDAVERKLYGWFWQCPNGKDCKYRHALPSGYVLKSQMKELLEAEAQNAVPIEDEIEQARAKVDARTPITHNVFLQWREKQVGKRKQKDEDSEAERKRKGMLTGREIFAEEGFVAEDDFGAHDAYERESDDEAEFAAVRAKAEAENQSQHSHQNGGPPATAAAQAGSSNQAGPSSSADADAGPSSSGINGSTHISDADQHLFLDEDESDEDEDEDEDELDELEASLQRQTKVS